jgi:hypothetical protein
VPVTERAILFWLVSVMLPAMMAMATTAIALRRPRLPRRRIWRPVWAL